MKKNKNNGIENKTLLESGGLDLKKMMKLGEPFIWLAGAGTAVMMFMILFIVSLLLFEGAVTFWPKKISQVYMKDGAVYAGYVSDREVYREQDSQGKILNETPRIQLMAGNRDITGEDFIWIDLPEVEKIMYPKDVMLLERREWGKMVAWPVGFRCPKREFAVGDSDFKKQLKKYLSEGSKRYRVMRSLEKGVISNLSYKINRLQKKIKYLEKRQVVDFKNRTKRNDLEIELSSQLVLFEKARAQLRELRDQDSKFILIMRTQDGDEAEMTFTHVVRALWPNQMNIFGKVSTYFSRLKEFVFEEPRESNTAGGVFPALFGTVMMTLIMTLAVVPFGVLAALYLKEYAKQGPLVSAIRIAVNNLAGVPSIVFGMFGLAFFVYRVGGSIDKLFFPDSLPTPVFGTGGILWASLTLALLTLPVVVVATEEALSFVPKGIKEGSLACGASKWQTVWNVILPSAAPGILTGVILAMSRGAGEVAPLMITGVVKLAPDLPLDGFFPFFHLERKFMHLGFHIYDVGFQSPNVEAAMPMVYASTALLLLVVAGLNFSAIVLRNRLRKKLSGSSF
jgi:phosphate transport system permease protein